MFYRKPGVVRNLSIIGCFHCYGTFFRSHIFLSLFNVFSYYLTWMFSVVFWKTNIPHTALSTSSFSFSFLYLPQWQSFISSLIISYTSCHLNFLPLRVLLAVLQFPSFLPFSSFFPHCVPSSSSFLLSFVPLPCLANYPSCSFLLHN